MGPERCRITPNQSCGEADSTVRLASQYCFDFVNNHGSPLFHEIDEMFLGKHRPIGDEELIVKLRIWRVPEILHWRLVILADVTQTSKIAQISDVIDQVSILGAISCLRKDVIDLWL
jgi:hypothetical protein